MTDLCHLLQKQLAEEQAMSRLASKSAKRDISEVTCLDYPVWAELANFSHQMAEVLKAFEA